jgi:chromosomal replication initiation ATPase DnaA
MTADEILAHVASAFDVTVAELRGRDRSRNLILARQAAYVVLYERPIPASGAKRSYAQIGKLLNRRVWAVHNGIKAVQHHARSEPAYAQTIANLIAM